MPTLLIFIMPVFLVVCGVLYGLECALRVSYLIASERKNNSYDLLAMSPPGGLVICWVICTSALYHKRQFARLHDIVRTSASIAAAVFGVMLGLLGTASLLMTLSYSRINPPALIPLFNGIMIVALIYMDFVQSTAAGCLVGLLIPTFGSGVMDSMLYTPGVFLMVKLGGYSLSTLTGWSLLDSLTNHLRWQGDLASIGMSFIRLGLVFAIQELILRTLWEILCRRTDSPSRAPDRLLQARWNHEH